MAWVLRIVALPMTCAPNSVETVVGTLALSSSGSASFPARVSRLRYRLHSCQRGCQREHQRSCSNCEGDDHSESKG